MKRLDGLFLVVLVAIGATAYMLGLLIGHSADARSHPLEERVARLEQSDRRQDAVAGPLKEIVVRDHCALLTLTTDTTTDFQRKACQP